MAINHQATFPSSPDRTPTLAKWRGDRVGVTGFEPATSSSRTTRATKLRHTPLCWFLTRRASSVADIVSYQSDENGLWRAEKTDRCVDTGAKAG